MKSVVRQLTFATVTAVAVCAAGAIHAEPAPTASYTVEEIVMPKGIAPEIGGLAFTSKGELVVVTRRSGILFGTPTQDPAAFKWRTFSDNSLHEPLGVLVEKDNQLLVPQFPELTRITDTDGDGVADFYQTVSDGWGVSGNYHESVVGPLPDGQGNWFLNIGTASHNGPTFDLTRGTFSPVGRRGRNFSAVDWRGWVMKVKPDGSLIPWASGFRANNGICMGPDGSLWVTDNQGDYRPTSPLYHVEKGKFYGHPSSLVWDKEFTKTHPGLDPITQPLKKLEEMRTEAAVLFPHGLVANSLSQPVFDQTGGKFGPFTGQMLIPDESGNRILRVMLEKVGGKDEAQWQGACTVFLSGNGLRPGNNRVCFSPDGRSLYVGQTMRGWGGPSEGLQRIVYQGKVPFEILTTHLTTDGFEIGFTAPVDPASATLKGNLQVRSYYYPYSQAYGASQKEVTRLEPVSVIASKNGLKLHIKLPKLTAKRIYQIDFIDLKSRTGESLAHPTVCYTANRLAK